MVVTITAFLLIGLCVTVSIIRAQEIAPAYEEF